MNETERKWLRERDGGMHGGEWKRLEETVKDGMAGCVIENENELFLSVCVLKERDGVIA